MRRYLTCFLALFCLLLAAFGHSEASIRQRKPRDINQPDNRARSPLMFGLRTGIIMSGGATVKTNYGSDWDADLNAGESFGGFLELSSPQWTTAALELNLHHVKPAHMPPAFDESRWMLDIGVALKPSIRNKSAKVVLRPVLGVGYGRMSGEEGLASAVNFMTVKLGAEGDFFFSARTGLLIEALATASPYGRATAEGANAVFDGEQGRYSLTAGLRPMIRVGLIFR